MNVEIDIFSQTNIYIDTHMHKQALRVKDPLYKAVGVCLYDLQHVMEVLHTVLLYYCLVGGSHKPHWLSSLSD